MVLGRIGARGSSQRHRLVATWVIVLLMVLALGSPQIEAGRSGALAAVQPAKATPIAHVRYIKRGLHVTTPNKKTVKGKVKMPVYAPSTLSTGTKQLASLGFKDGTVLQMNQRTTLVLRNPHLTYVNGGQVDEILAPGTSHRVQTATSTAAAIGTEFLVRESVQIREVKRGKGKKRHVQREKVHVTVFIVEEGALQVKSSKGSILVKTDQKTTVQEGKAPLPPVKVDATPALAWTKPIPPPTVHTENLVLDANGGQVVGYSSQAAPASQRHSEERTRHAAPQLKGEQAGTSQPWAAANINDGRLETGWMSAQGQVTNQWVKLQLENGNAYQISGVVIDPSATNGADPSNALRDFQIRVSTTGTADADFTTVFSGTCQRQKGLQIFSFPRPVDARYVELYALSNQGGHDGIAVAELEVVGAPAAIAPRGYTFTLTFDIHIKESAEPVLTPTPGTFHQAFAPPSDSDQIRYSLTGSVCNSDPYGSAWNMSDTYYLWDRVNPQEKSAPQTFTFQQTFAHGAPAPFAGRTAPGMTFDLSLTTTNPVNVQVDAHVESAVAKVTEQTFTIPLTPVLSC